MWSIWTVGPTVHTQWGTVNGEMQNTATTFDALYVGQKNEKSAEIVAEDHMNRQIELKKREGYASVLGESLVELNPYTILPETIRFYKPDNSPGEKIRRKEASLAYTRKRDGFSCIVQVVQGQYGGPEVLIYSRTMRRTCKDEGIPWAARFPLICASLEKLNVPLGTVFLGELVASPQVDNKDYVSTVCNSLTQKALEVQMSTGHLYFVIWDIVFWGGVEVLRSETWGQRGQRISQLTCDYVLPVETFSFPDMAAAAEYAASLGWEGFVAVDPDGMCTGAKGAFIGYSEGEAKRPGEFSAKIKPKLEDDFIARYDPSKGVGVPGKGKHTGYVGSLALYQLNSAGEEVYICDMGGGLTDALRKDLAFAEYPICVKVEFAQRRYKSNGDISNSLEFPVLVEIRSDKSPSECVNPYL